MIVLIKMTVPIGSSVGPVFNIIPDVGTASPSTANINDLTGDGVLVTVDDAVVNIAVESTGICTNSVSANIYDDYLCLTILDAFGYYYSLQQTSIIYTNGQPSSYSYIVPAEAGDIPTNITWNPSLERWEASLPGDPSTLLAYLSGTSSVGSTGWVSVGVNPFDFSIYSTTQGKCCNCVTITYSEDGTYGGNYTDCNGETQTWSTSESGESFQNYSAIFCTNNPASITYEVPTPEGVEQVVSVGTEPCESGICVPICAAFSGGDSFDPFNVQLTFSDDSNFAVRDGKIVYFGTFTIGEIIVVFYIRWSADNSRWELRTDLDNASSTYAFIPSSLNNGTHPPISDEWECALIPSDECVKSEYGIPVTSYEPCVLMCVTFNTVEFPVSVQAGFPYDPLNANRDGATVYYVDLGTISFYIRWSADNNRWEMRIDIDDPSTTYAFLEGVQSSQLPIGSSWQGGPALPLYSESLGLPETLNGSCNVSPTPLL